MSKLADLKGRPIAISSASDNTFWPWLRATLGFTDSQKRPYAFSMQPFLADKQLSQQGFATSEPYSIEKAGVKPVVFLLNNYKVMVNQWDDKAPYNLISKIESTETNLSPLLAHYGVV